MPIGFDWVFWTAGGLLGALALLVFYWSLFHDRSRGRRRCPRCWYDMSGTPGNLTCSECGYTATRERKLFKTRRRWRWMLAAIFLGFASSGIALVPLVRNRGIDGTMPNAALIVIVPWIEPASPLTNMWTGLPPAAPNWKQRLADELDMRAMRDELRPWEWRLLMWRMRASRGEPWTLSSLTRDAWPEGTMVHADVGANINTLEWYWLRNSTIRITISHGDQATTRLAYPNRSVATLPTAQWTEPTLNLGRLSDDIRNVKLDVHVERIGQRTDEWITLSRQRRSHNVNVVQSNGQLPVAVFDPQLAVEIERRLVLQITEEGIGIRWSRTYQSDEQVLPTLAMKFELLQDNEAIAQTRAWWTTEIKGEQSLAGPNALPNHYHLSWDRVQWNHAPISFSSIANETTWQLRITADSQLALRDIRSKSYWSGELLLELKWDTQINALRRPSAKSERD